MAIEAWMVAEAAKRRLLHQLDELSLPVESRSEAAPDGLVFDLVHLPGEGGITGHLDGIVTLDLAETDDLHRDELRRRLGEPFRTVIGHLRHEIGHHYWGRLVGQSDRPEHLSAPVRRRTKRLSSCRRAVLRGRHRSVGSHQIRHRLRRVPPARGLGRDVRPLPAHLSHYLHIVDATDTAVAYDLVPHDRAHNVVAERSPRAAFDDMLDAWRPINAAVNAIAESLGVPAVYPFDPTGAVIDKLAFVHQQISAHAERERFYASH